MIEACDGCLRRSHLIARLAPRIAAILGRPRHVRAGVLGLDEAKLVDALAGSGREEALRYLDDFDPNAKRSRLLAADVDATCSHGRSYPLALNQLDDPPAVLFVAGGLARMARLTADKVVTVVGSRSPSPYGIEVARSLARGLAATGTPVVSGLALGIDGAAHRGALNAGGPTLAVLGGGPDVAYPRSHRGLLSEVRESGAVVSEMPPGQAPFRWCFPARNRIMAALGSMTVVVEAAEESGSLITAEFALDLQRALGAVPGKVTSPKAAGSNRLLFDGAHVVRGAEDVLELLYGSGARPEVAPDPALVALLADDPQLKLVLDAVETGEDVDSMGTVTGLPPGRVRASLGRLERLGLIARQGLGPYERTAPV